MTMNRIDDRIVKFAGDNIGVYKMFRDYFNHYRAINGAKNVQYETVKSDGSLISFQEKEDQMNAALRKEIFRVAGIQNTSEFPLETMISNPMLNYAMFAVVNALVDMILPETVIESVGLYSDVRTIGWGDSAAFEVKPRDLFVVSKAGKAQRMNELKKQFNGMVTIVPEMRELTVGVSLYRVLAGKESLAEFAMKAVRSMETALSADIYSAFYTAMGALQNTPSGQELRIAGYTQTGLVQLGQRVQAWNGGAKPVIVGTQLALQNVLPLDANYRYDLSSEYVRLGYIVNAFGFDCVMLPQLADWENFGATKIADNRLWLISASSQKLVKVVLEGATMSNTTGPFDAANLTQTTTMWKSWGTGIATNAVAATIELS